MVGHAQLKFVMTECSKSQNRLTRPICEVMVKILQSGEKKLLTDMFGYYV